jgi:hypothetical protein
VDHYTGVYGTLKTANAANTPGDRVQGATWTDTTGKFWLFGGDGPDSVTAAPLPLNDLWMFDPASKEWTWEGGPSTVAVTGTGAGNAGTYAAEGSLNANNQPGSRYQATTWTDSNGNLWMFGGEGNDSTSTTNLSLNDLWMYSISSGEWNWVGGPSTVTHHPGMAGVYGTIKTPASTNWPGGRYGASAWVDGSGNVWLFGGNGYDINGSPGELDDLWMYNPTTGNWTWMAGSNTASPAGVFGVEGSANAANIPPPRFNAMKWTDTGGNFWLFAGRSTSDSVNDLWRFNAVQAAPQTAATPAISPTAGTFTSTQSVTITDSTAGAAIYYTTNGTTPTATSTLYSGAISVSATETIEAIAVAAGFTNSAVASVSYTINLPAAAAPTFSPAVGTYTSAQNVTITDNTAGAVIYYTTNGTTPTAASTLYAGAISVSSTETIEAIAIAPGFANSIVSTAAYTINLPAATPVISPAAGTYTSTQSVTITDGTAGATIYYTTNGTTPTASSTVYGGAISVASSETIEAIAVANGFSNSAVASASYTINLPAATPVMSPVAGTYTSAQSVTITDATTGAAIYYTTNGTTPTASSTLYSGTISVSSTETIEAIAIAGGFSNSAVASATYTISLAAAATPVISPAAGTYTSTQSVTITDATTGAAIYYTTNGSSPTASSTLYSGALSVSSTETIEAIAVAGGFSNSTVASAAYVIQVVTPSYTLAANPSSLTIKSGSTGTTVITLTPTGGFTGTVNFSCGSLPTDVTCGFAPGSLTVPSGSALTTTLTVGTSGTTTASLREGPNGTLLPEIFVAMILLPLGFTRRMLRARKGGNPWLMGLLLLATTGLAAAGVAAISGCGGSSKKTTAAGTYTVPVEVTSGGTTVPLSLSITVQ